MDKVFVLMRRFDLLSIPGTGIYLVYSKDDENSTIIITVNPTFITIKLISYIFGRLVVVSKSTSENENNQREVFSLK